MGVAASVFWREALVGVVVESLLLVRLLRALVAPARSVANAAALAAAALISASLMDSSVGTYASI